MGAKLYAISTFELTIPTFLPEQYGIKAALFSDVGTAGLLGGGAAVGERAKIAGIQGDGAGSQGAAHAVAGQVVAPLHLDAAVQALHEAVRQGVQGFVQQLLAGLALGGVQAVGV